MQPVAGSWEPVAGSWEPGAKACEKQARSERTASERLFARSEKNGERKAAGEKLLARYV
jgi:hypothetical protein